MIRYIIVNFYFIIKKNIHVIKKRIAGRCLTARGYKPSAQNSGVFKTVRVCKITKRRLHTDVR